jgi:hypothetical protein
MNGVPFAGTSEPNGGLPLIPKYHGMIYSTAGNHDRPSVDHQNFYQILDNVTKVWKSHSFKMGIHLESIRSSYSESMYPRGRYSFYGNYSALENMNYGSGAADMLTDNMWMTTLSPAWNTSYYRWYRAAYFQDDWKVTPKLTLNLGARYDYFQPISNKNGELSNVEIASQGLTSVAAGAGDATGTGFWDMTSKVQDENLLPASFLAMLATQNMTVKYLPTLSMETAQRDNIAPRVGFSWQIDPKTVVRSGYGIFFGALEDPSSLEITVNYPFAYSTALSHYYMGSNTHCVPSPYAGATNQNSTCLSTGTPDLTSQTAHPFPYNTSIESGMEKYLENGGISAFAGAPVVNMVSTPNVHTPYTQSYNLTVERELSRNLLATIAYIGNSAKHTFASTNEGSNIALTNPDNPVNTAPFTGLYFNSTMAYAGEQMYNALQAKLEKRYSHGLSFLATYTWSRAEDDASGPNGGGPSDRNTNLIPLKDEFTNANYDARHRLTVNGSYKLPFGKGERYVSEGGLLDYLVGGWSTSLTWIAQTGMPFTVGTGSTFQTAAGAEQVNAIRVSDPFKGGGTVPSGNVDTTSCPAKVKTRDNWYNPCAFIDPKSGLDIGYATDANGNVTLSDAITDEATAKIYLGGKSNQIYGPGYERINMSLFKDFKTWREQYFQFRVDAFNLLNHPTWGNPSDTSTNSTGGQITAVQTLQGSTPDARFLQFAAKYVF